MFKNQSYRCRVAAFTQDDQLICINGERDHNASIEKPGTPKIIKEIKALSENLTVVVEGWHYGIQALFSGSHPEIWKLLANLQKEAAVQKLNS